MKEPEADSEDWPQPGELEHVKYSIWMINGFFWWEVRSKSSQEPWGLASHPISERGCTSREEAMEMVEQFNLPDDLMGYVGSRTTIAAFRS